MSKSTLNINEIKANFSRYVRLAMSGKRFVIAHRNKPVAQLIPLYEATSTNLKFGVLKGEFKIADDFDAPLVDFEHEFYGDK